MLGKGKGDYGVDSVSISEMPVHHSDFVPKQRLRKLSKMYHKASVISLKQNEVVSLLF